MSTRLKSLPARLLVSTAPVSAPASPKPYPNTGIVRVSWNHEERSPAEDDIQEYLLKNLLLGRTFYTVKMRLSRSSAFLICNNEEDAKQVAKVKAGEVAGITLQFSLVPQSSLDEDYSCSVLMFGMHWLQRWDQEARLVSLIKAASDSSPDVELSHENGDYDILIISAEMALVFVDERKKDQLGSLAGIFNYPGVTNRCAPNLKTFRMTCVPVEHRSKEALCHVFAQWKPEIVLQDDTAVITIANPSAAVMGEVRACCESVAGQAVSIECPAELRENLATDTVTEVEVESLPPDKLAYFGTIRKDPNVSVHVDGGVVSITGPKHSCLEYKKMVETAPLHTLDSTLDPDIVRFLSTTPAKESLTELAKSCQCACFESEAGSAEPKLVIVSESEADASACKDKLKRKYAVVSIPNSDHAILHNEAEGLWEHMKGRFEYQTPSVQILLEGNIVKFVGEQKDIDVIRNQVLKLISEFLMTDMIGQVSKDRFAVMKHSSKWCDIEDLGRRLCCKIIERRSADPNLVRLWVRGKTEDVKKIWDKIDELREGLVAKAVQIDSPGIQKVFRNDSHRLLAPSPSSSALITCDLHPLRDVFLVERGKISRQMADVLFNSTNGGLNLRYGQIAQDLAAVAGPTFKRECSQLVKDNGSVPTGDVAVTGAGNLQAQFVIHGNVKTYSSAHPQESIASLRGVVQRALEECDRRRLQSIAFPAIGIGNLSFPPDVAIKALVGSAVDYLMTNRAATTIRKVILVGFEERAHDRFHSELEQQCGFSLASIPRQCNIDAVHSTTWTVPDYPGLRLPTLELDPPPRGTPPLGTPLEFSILAESEYHCSRAEAELQQNVDRLLKKDEVADETIEQLPTSFMTTFLASAEAAHVQVKIHHNPAKVELSGPKEDVEKAVETLRTALIMLNNHLVAIDKQVSGELQHFHWQKLASRSVGMATMFSREECYELEKARQLQRKTATLNQGQSRQVTFDVERLVEVTAGATRPIRISRVRNEEGFAKPETWEGTDIAVELEKTSEEFQQVATRFERSVGRRVTIVKIERIQNNQLWQAYQAHRQETLRETPSGTPAERTLYHGCPINNVDGINRNGFVTNFAGRANAAYFGRGIYFARDASYSANDSYSKRDKKTGHKHMYCCRVLTGVFKTGHDGMLIPPVNEATKNWCHSTVNWEKNPSVFVIYNDNRAYPEYLITFK